jgi:hypothetical protein
MTDAFYVYQGSINGVIVYIGMGSKDRYFHLNSGVSHLYLANKAHFDGVEVLTEKIYESVSKEEALELEKELIKIHQPVWNSTYTDAYNLKRYMNKVLSKYAHIENKWTNLGLLQLLALRITGDYTAVISCKEFQEHMGALLPQWLANLKLAKGGHPFIVSVEKLKSATYIFQVNRNFVDKLETEILGIKLERKTN